MRALLIRSLKIDMTMIENAHRNDKSGFPKPKTEQPVDQVEILESCEPVLPVLGRFSLINP